MSKRAKNTTSGALHQEHADGKFSTPEQLAAAIRRDRRARKLTWPAYAAWIGVKLSTIYKISRGATRLPHELTLDRILEKWAAEPIEGGASEVVSGGQRHPERS